MSFKAQAITIIPAFTVFLIAIYLAMLSFITSDIALKQQTLFLAVAMFFGGLAMAICWAFYWAVAKTRLMNARISKKQTSESSSNE